METKEIAEIFKVSPAWARRVKQRRRETGRTSALPRGGSRPKVDGIRLAALVEEQPDATLYELRERLGVKCSESSMVRALQRIGMTFKKRRSMLQSRIGRTL
jgi:transposase